MGTRITEHKHTLMVLVKVADQRERVREQKGKRKGNGVLKRREEIKEETVTIVGAQDMQVRSVLSDQLGLKRIRQDPGWSPDFNLGTALFTCFHSRAT